MTQVLFGTRNKTRLEFLKGILDGLPLDILSLNDLNIDTVVAETGSNPEENSKQKVMEYFKHAKIPTFSIDSGLYIDKFPSEKQPGVFVRRINKDTYEASDDEMLAYYIRELEKCGGSSDAKWVNAISIAVSETEMFHTVINRATTFTSIPCTKHTAGEPLNSIQIDKRSKKYVAELSVEEKIESQQEMVAEIRNFFIEHLKYISEE